MRNATTTMPIYIHHDLLRVQRERLERELSVFKGVTAVRFSYSLKCWMIVTYNPESTNSEKILNQVTFLISNKNCDSISA